MSIAESIALDVADLPTAPFDVEGPVLEGPVLEGPVLEGPVLEGPVLEGPVLDERVLDEWEGEAAPSRTPDHGIEDESPPTSGRVPLGEP